MLAVPALLVCTVLFVGVTRGQNNTCEAQDEKRHFLDLITDVCIQLTERHLSDHTLPVCTQLKGKPSLDKEPQLFQKVTNKWLYVFSAYYEARKEAEGPAIRIIGAGFQKRYNLVGNHYCQLWYDSLKHPVSVGPASYNVIYPSTLHGDMWVSHFIVCTLPENMHQLPYAVSVTATRCEQASNILMVLNRKPREKSNSHALCISPMYGRYNQWQLVIEQIELHKLLGAQEIVLYDLDPSANTKHVLNSYTDDMEENVTVIQWKFPPGLKTNVWCQRGALNDCVYRMSQQHKYVTVTDMDEVLVPRQENTWTELIRRLHAAHPDTGAFLFQHAYFRRNHTEESPALVTQSSFWRTDKVTPPGKIRCKALYEADKAISVDLHFPYVLLPSANELLVAPADGMLHHYRPYPMENFVKKANDYTFIEDRYMERYKEELSKAVTKRIDKLNFDAV